MKKIYSSLVIIASCNICSFAKAQFAQPQMFPQQQFQRMPMFMDAQAGQMQMMGQGGMMPPGFVGQVPGSYNDPQCLNNAMLMPQAPINPAFYNQQQQMMNGHQGGF
jgi:hypothetical protein